MEWYAQSALAIGVMLGLIALGLPISISFALVGVVGMFLLEGMRSLHFIPQIINNTGGDFVLVTIPLFILMAEILAVAGFTQRLYSSFDTLIGRIPGATGIATFASSGSFAAVCGSSYVTIATIGRMALPELLSRGYTKSLASGIIAAGGTLGILIPPSIAFVIYGFLADVSIGKLFFSGVVPGLVLLALFCLTVVVQVTLKPVGDARTGITWRDRGVALLDIAPIIVVATAVTGSIYLGFATPTESAAVGCIAAFGAVLAYRRFSLAAMIEALTSTAITTGFIMLLLIGAKIFAFYLALIGLADELSTVAEGVGQPYLVLLIVMLVLLVAGMFMDGMAMLVLFVPVFVPMLVAIGFDPIWFGVIFVLFMELGLITPPVGVNGYMVAQMGKPYGVTIRDAFSGILPFCACILATVTLVILFPQLALWLPSTMIR